ncbi:MAG: hydroxymethylbilane synthase, partial [Hyphomicrobiaceae bacterium]|nr:hydroxymethylbilane synthase [Hyphomicrobiaceae bacterium]
DAFISTKGASLAQLPAAAVVGTSSLRRQAQVKQLRCDLRVVPLRGNVDTRLRKLQEGAVDATLLACAGLARLGLSSRITQPVPVEDMLPAVAQGAIGVEIRADDNRIANLLAPINHAQTALAVTAERAFLARLDGSCKTPIAGLAQLVAPDRLVFRGQILSPDGRRCHATRREGPPEAAIAMAEAAAAELIARAGPDFFRTRA